MRVVSGGKLETELGRRVISANPGAWGVSRFA